MHSLLILYGWVFLCRAAFNGDTKHQDIHYVSIPCPGPIFQNLKKGVNY